MCDLSTLNALREQAQSAPEVTIKSEILLKLLDPVIVVTIGAANKRKPRSVPAVDPEDDRCARWLYDTLLKTAPKAKEPNFTTWANDVRLMRERDDRTHKEICELFRWAHKDSFWCANILSPKTLREQWDRLDIQRKVAAEPKKSGAWWLSDAAKMAKAIEVGVGPALGGESAANWEARIRAAIDNGGKPPAPQVFVRPAAAQDPTPADVDGARTPKPRGFLKDALKQIREQSAA